MISVQGKGTIKATIIADSINENSNRITTFELEYPRFIHSEFMTHRMFSRNAMSSRAIPIEKMIEQVRNNPAMPIHWGANQAGMQANEELSPYLKQCATEEWLSAAKMAAFHAETMSKYGAHKQIANRLLEPFQVMKTVCTATEFDNWFLLRNHSDAQPEIHELARVMLDARNQSEPELLKSGEWHTPYVDHFITPETDDPMGYMMYENNHPKILFLDQALKVSASCCAQVSYRLLDDSLDKALIIYDKLVESKPVHASPFEHQATPIECPFELIDDGTTHIDVMSNVWSGNLKGWVQHRQLIPNNTCWKYTND